MSDTDAARNTDHELYREDTGNPAGSYYENSLHVTDAGTIGMNVGGFVITMPIAEWHRLAVADLFVVRHHEHEKGLAKTSNTKYEGRTGRNSSPALGASKRT